jgi:hypothetical protein
VNIMVKNFGLKMARSKRLRFHSKEMLI